MAKKDLKEDVDVIEEQTEDLDEEKDAYEDESGESDDFDDSAEPEEKHDEEMTEALEELETQELQLLDEDASVALLVDEVQELRAMRREELTMTVDAKTKKTGEFVCQSCFMVKRTSQLANKRKMICQDCVA